MYGLMDGLLGFLGGLLGFALMIPFLVFGLLAFLLITWPFVGFLAASYFSGANEGRRQKQKQPAVAQA